MFQLPPLPYAYDSLEPTIGSQTMHVHHDKHHAKYVDTLNDLLKDQPSHGSLEDVVAQAGAAGGKLYNNAGQAWNHAFFWESMTPSASAPPAAFSALRDAFVAEGVGHFASGWVWLVSEGGAPKVVSTHDAGSFDQLGGATPLLVCDLWEHAYYLDHKQDRKGFLERWFDTLANWPLAERQLAAAGGQGSLWTYPNAS